MKRCPALMRLKCGNVGTSLGRFARIILNCLLVRFELIIITVSPKLICLLCLLRIALELPVDLPDEVYLERWFAEPIKAVILPTKIFLTNAKGYPVLSKKHQAFVKKLIKVCILYSNIIYLVMNISFLTNCKPSSLV